MISAAFPAAVLAALFLSSPAFAEPKITFQTEYYEVRGYTAEEVRISMNEHHRRSHGFGSHDALTAGSLKWSTGSQPAVRMHIVQKLPFWVDSAYGRPALQVEWARFMKALQVHEDGHRRIQEEEARAVEEVLIRAGSNPPATLKRDINKIMSAFAKKQIAYDKETGHGRTQGAVFQVVLYPDADPIQKGSGNAVSRQKEKDVKAQSLQKRLEEDLARKRERDR